MEAKAQIQQRIADFERQGANRVECRIAAGVLSIDLKKPWVYLGLMPAEARAFGAGEASNPAISQSGGPFWSRLELFSRNIQTAADLNVVFRPTGRHGRARCLTRGRKVKH